MRTAIITGASFGIGREFARICAQNGYDLILTARSRQQLEALADELAGNTKRNVIVLPKDLADPAAPRELFEEVRRLDLHPEIVINNAGFGLVGRFWELDELEQVQMIQLNVTALTHLTRLFLPEMIERRCGHILNVASTAAFQPGPLMSVYYATKAYVVSFSEAIHNEARDYGVTVTCLCPGPTKTEFQNRAGANKTKLFNRGRAMDAAQVAQIGFAAMQFGKPLAIAGRVNALMAFLTRFAPIQFTATMARRFQESL